MLLYLCTPSLELITERFITLSLVFAGYPIEYHEVLSPLSVGFHSVLLLNDQMYSRGTSLWSTISHLEHCRLVEDRRNPDAIPTSN